MMTVAAAVLVVMNVLAFAFMGIDKHRAQKGQWRIRERTLLLLSAFFGAAGGTAGMFLFHHKTRHWYFRFGFPAMLAVQLVLLAWLVPQDLSM